MSNITSLATREAESRYQEDNLVNVFAQGAEWALTMNPTDEMLETMLTSLSRADREHDQRIQAVYDAYMQKTITQQEAVHRLNLETIRYLWHGMHATVLSKEP